ncbi:IclR family transcriptional regulator [Lacisediminihabitans profunda]|nr:helix-turn-helix domain-containing protein [Lacisediminihabitans profunda]
MTLESDHITNNSFTFRSRIVKSSRRCWEEAATCRRVECSHIETGVCTVNIFDRAPSAKRVSEMSITVDDVPEPVSETDKGAIQSIERAGQILSLFDQDTLNLSVATVAERLGLNRTTAHRYLLSLQSSGFLDKTNAPGPILDQLSAFISGRRKVLSLAPPIMRELSDKTQMTVVMSLLGRSGPVVALVEEAAVGTILVTVRVGTVLAPKSAQSRVLVAFQSEQSVISQHLSGMTEVEARMEEVELGKVRRDRLGWADLGHLGLAAVAAPVFGSRNVQAAIALIGTAKMLPTSDNSVPLARDLQTAAAQLSKLVGG